jgi:hypothetical protein
MSTCFKNNHGFSMVQAMVIAALLAGTSLVTTKLLTDQKLAQKGAETRDQIEELHNLIYSFLQNRLHCKNTVIQNQILSSNILPLTDVNFTKISPLDSTSPAVETYTINNNKIYMNNNVIVKQMTLKAPTDSSGMRKFEVTYERLRGDDSRKRTKKGLGARDIKKSIFVRIQINPTTNFFDGCYAFNKTGDKTTLNNMASSETGNDLTKEMCLEMNTGLGSKAFEWDEAKSVCKLKTQCPTGQLYAGIDSLGTVICKNILDWNFNEVLDTSGTTCPAGSTAKFQIDETTKKVKISCGDTYISCQHALTSLGTNTATVTLKINSTDIPVYCRRGISGGNLGIDNSYYYALIASVAYNETRTWNNLPVATGLLSGSKLSTTNINLIWNGSTIKRMLLTTSSGDSIWGSASANTWLNGSYTGSYDSNCGFSYGQTISSTTVWSWYQQNGNGQCLHGDDDTVTWINPPMGRYPNNHSSKGNTLFYISSMGLP